MPASTADFSWWDPHLLVQWVREQAHTCVPVGRLEKMLLI